MATTEVDLSKPITLTTFHPDWEIVEKSFWMRRIVLMISGVFALIVVILVGFNLPGSVMPGLFTGEEKEWRILEFSFWFFNSVFFLEIVLIANHKTRTTQIKYNISKNEEMRVSITFNRSLSLLFIGIFIFTILKIIIKYILGLKFEDSNIWRYLAGECLTPALTPLSQCDIRTWLFNALYVCIGFGSYSQFLYVFEKVVMGRKHPLLWLITPIGLFIMIFLPYDFILLRIPFTSTLIMEMPLYFFGQWLAMSGGIIVPILYLIMGRRFAFSGHEQTSKDCYLKGIGFTIAALGAVFDVVSPLAYLSWGGILAVAEVFIWVILAPLLTFIGIILVRKAYRPHG